MKLKICGLKFIENITDVSQLLPDYMGFIFWEKSARYFDGMVPNIPDSIRKVGVFVNASVEYILEKTQKYKLDLIQLHGNESPEFCQIVQTNNIKIIKAFSIDDTFDFSILEEYEPFCDYFLFDTKGKLPGGNGTKFNWKMLEKYQLSKPIFLSGGIGIEDIPHIKKLELPIHAIDVNSKFETEPGLKNIDLLRTFKQQLYDL